MNACYGSNCYWKVKRLYNDLGVGAGLVPALRGHCPYSHNVFLSIYSLIDVTRSGFVVKRIDCPGPNLLTWKQTPG